MIVIANVFPKLKNTKSFVKPLPKKRRLRTRFECEHLKAFQILAKSPRERSSHVLSSFSGNLISKIFPLVLREILVVFVNTLTGDGVYPVQD